MTVKPIRDEGQTLPPPRGKVIGVVDTQQQFDRVVAALQKAGFDKITALKGDDGIQLLERLDGFFFSDADEPVLHRNIDELKAGHISIAVETSSPQAEEAAQVASDNGARFLVHFGYLTVSWLKK
jgi:hypothetical protein